MIGLRIPLLASGLALSAAAAASAGDPVGTWQTEQSEAMIRIAPCGDALCGKLSALREPRDPATGRIKTDTGNRDPQLRSRPLIGVQIVVAMRPSGQPGQWTGHVYNPEDGGLYPATLTMLNGRALRLEGCMLRNMLCRGQTWQRAK
jgi:uncharacterized protein (DUF2147 family)